MDDALSSTHRRDPDGVDRDDLTATLAGQPLCVHLGGERRNTPCLLVGGYPGPEETATTLGEQMRLFADRQPTGVKLASSSNLQQDTRRLRASAEKN